MITNTHQLSPAAHGRRLPAFRRRNNAAAAVLDVDADAVDTFELPDADLSGEELTARVLPKQSDEFTCFLVQHRSRMAPSSPAETP
jgi:hypothetical protein